MLKRLSNNKEIPAIPPVFHLNKFVTNFKEKFELLNSFSSDQMPTVYCLPKLIF